MTRSIVIILMLLFLGKLSKLYASDVQILVLDFTGTNVTAHQAENARNRILLRLINDKSITVIEPDTVQKAPSGIFYSEDKHIPINKKADYVIYGTLDRVKGDKLHILYVRVVNSFTGSLVYSGSHEFTSPNKVLTAADVLAGRLIEKLKSYRPARYYAKQFRFSLDVYCSYVQPLDDLYDILYMGGSMTVIAGVDMNDFLLGFRTGLLINDGTGNNKYSVMVPMQLHYGYSFSLYSSFYLSLSASGGIVYQYLEKKDSTNQGFSAIVTAGVSPGYTFSEHISIILPIETSCIIEGTEDLWSISAGVGIQYRY